MACAKFTKVYSSKCFFLARLNSCSRIVQGQYLEKLFDARARMHVCMQFFRLQEMLRRSSPAPSSCTAFKSGMLQ